MRLLLLLLPAAVSSAAVSLPLGCVHAPLQAAEEARPRWHSAPPKPGQSITNSKACSCHACSPASCCQGEEEANKTNTTCNQSYDFSAPGCGLEVESCTSRCYRKVWRAKLHEACAASAPAECCGSVD